MVKTRVFKPFLLIQDNPPILILLLNLGLQRGEMGGREESTGIKVDAHKDCDSEQIFDKKFSPRKSVRFKQRKSYKSKKYSVLSLLSYFFICVKV